MKTFRIVLGILAIVPFILLMDNVLHPASYGPDSLGQLAYSVFGLPILTLNYWVWFEPTIIKFYFFEKEAS